MEELLKEIDRLSDIVDTKLKNLIKNGLLKETKTYQCLIFLKNIL